ncbi:MAG: hypothetical protein ABSC47_13565 [Terracidiphilus sp.]|jgi:hypothetical protein
MSDQTAIARVEQAGQIDTNTMMRELVEKGPAAVDAVVRLHEYQTGILQRQQLAAAMARVKEKLKTVIAMTSVFSENKGYWMYDYAPMEQLQGAVEGPCREEGLDVGFTSRREGPNANIVVGICIVKLTASGYAETFEASMNAAGATGGDAGAIKTSQRKALIGAFNLKIVQDRNARILGEYIPVEQAKQLHDRVEALSGAGVKVDEVALLAWAAGIKDRTKVIPDRDWLKIRVGKLVPMENYLDDEEAKAGIKKTGPAAEEASASAPSPAPTPAAAASTGPIPPPAAAGPNMEDQGGDGSPSAPPPAERWAINVLDGGAKSLKAALQAMKPAYIQAAKDTAGIKGKVSDLKDDAAMRRFLICYKELETKGIT